MMLLLKAGGLVLIFITSSLVGISRAFQLKKRSEILRKICISLSEFAQLIRGGAGELKRLLEMSFDNEILRFEDEKPIMSCSYFDKEDTRLAESFLREIGMADSEREYKHALLYQTLFEQRAREAEKKSEKLSKLYTSLGVLTGLSICIFLV